MKSLVKIAVAGALLASGTAAYADVAVPQSGNGELVLFVRDAVDASKVYARGLGIFVNDLLTESQITSDPTKPDPTNPNQFADTDTLTYTLPAPILKDANLNTFLSGGSTYVWGIMAGDNQGTNNAEGTRRYVTTSTVDFTTTVSSLPNSTVGNAGSYGNLQGMLQVLNGALPDEQGSSIASGGLWGQAGTSYTAAPLWFGTAGPSNQIDLGQAAHLYLITQGSNNPSQLARVYKGIDITLGLDGTLSSASAGPGGPEVPLPAAVWLLGSALVGFSGISRRRRRSDAAVA